MTQQTQAPTAARSGPGAPPPDRGQRWPWLKYVRVTWSRPAAIRAIRAMIIIPGLFALCFKVIKDPQMTVFATFGGFGALVLTSFGGSRKDKAIAHAGLALAGSATLVIGTLVSGSAWLAAVVTVPVVFAICFAAVAGQNAASGVTAALLAYVLPVASAGPASLIPSRLEGWLLAMAVSTAGVLLLSPRTPGDQLRAAAAAAAQAQANHLTAALAGTATRADLDASLAAKHELMDRFAATPYRPTGLATTDQALASVIHMLEWSAGLTCDAMGGHLDLSAASPQDKKVLAESADALRAVADLLSGCPASVDLEAIWHARTASAVHLRELTGDEAAIRLGVGYAYHAQAIGLATSAAAADAMIAAGKASREFIAQQRRHWVDGLPHSQDEPPQQATQRLTTRLEALFAADASSRSVWFRNSARAAVALAGAVAVARLFNVQHGFWVVLGTLSVLRTSASSTGATALRALGGTAIGFIIGAALLVAIGTSEPALWAAFPIAVAIAAYTPGTAPFALGQAAFTITVVVLFNLLVPAGWQVGLIRIEDVALGCAVSVVVGALFWPRGAAAVVGDNLADALRAGADYLTEATKWALGLVKRRPGQANEAISAGTRLDDSVRGFLNEQGTKQMPKADLWMLVMAAQRIRLTAHSLSSLPLQRRAGHDAAPAEVTTGPRARQPVYADLAAFYDQIAGQVGRPAHGNGPVVLTELPLPDSLRALNAAGYETGDSAAVSADPELLWVRMHLEQLTSHATGLPAPAAEVARLRNEPWWHRSDHQRPGKSGTE
jgi:uncharacterized membrane protein YccC